MQSTRSLFISLAIIVSIKSMAQTAAEQTVQGQQARKILLQNQIKTECFNVTTIPEGLIIGSRTAANIPVNYLYTNDKSFKKIDHLDRYIVFGYSPVKNELLLGK